MVGARACLRPLCVASALLAADAHGRLTFPTTRLGDAGYEGDPVPSNTDERFVCRRAEANPSVTPAMIAAGGTTQVQWDMSAPREGDCALFISYDIGLPHVSQRYMKIANFPDCASQSGQRVSVVIPSVLPAGDAILRWDWRALHMFPTVEWYAQCADVRVSSTSARTWDSFDNRFRITSPPIYPADGNQAPGFRNPFGGDFYLTGPACVDGTVNQCDLTAPGARGYTGVGGATSPPTVRPTAAPTAEPTSTPTASPTAPTASPTAPTSAPSPSPTSGGTCGSTCYGSSCNLWVEQGYTCAQLTWTYGCMCQGCSACASTPSPTVAPTPVPTPATTTSTGCAASCFGNSCDFWGGRGYTCEQLTGDFGCACDGCAVCAAGPSAASFPALTPGPTEAPTESGGRACVATPGLNRGVTDSDCQQCPTGYRFWPCNEDDLCRCTGSFVELAGSRRLGRRERAAFLAPDHAMLQTYVRKNGDEL